jgi:hypothetical protein
MPVIVVTEEQAELIKNAPGGVEFFSPTGERLGVMTPMFTEEDIRLAKAAASSGSPRYTTAQVLEHLRSLESSPAKTP